MQSTGPYVHSCTENPVLVHVRTAVQYRDSDSATTVQDSQYSCTYCTLHGTPLIRLFLRERGVWLGLLQPQAISRRATARRAQPHR
jgi:hypothetical protein